MTGSLRAVPCCTGTGSTLASSRQASGRPAQGRPADGPDESECRSGCQNLAYTDRDNIMLQQLLAILRNGTADPLSPMPLRSRLQAQADQIQQIIERHDTSRSAQPGAVQEQERQ